MARDLNDDLKPYIERLLLNQLHLGTFIGQLVKDADFGVAATDLLKEHITIAKEILDIAKVEEAIFTSFEIHDALGRWDKNGEKIADALASKAIGRLDVQDDFKLHLTQTRREIENIFQGDMGRGLIWLDAARKHMHFVGRKLVDAYYK